MRAMSIIGIIWFSICLITIIYGLGQNDASVAGGWGVFAVVYGLPFSIVGLVFVNKQNKIKAVPRDQLISLYELKEKGIITAEEFDQKKAKFLNQG